MQMNANRWQPARVSGVERGGGGEGESERHRDIEKERESERERERESYLVYIHPQWGNVSASSS